MLFSLGSVLVQVQVSFNFRFRVYVKPKKHKKKIVRKVKFWFIKKVTRGLAKYQKKSIRVLAKYKKKFKGVSKVPKNKP